MTVSRKRAEEKKYALIIKVFEAIDVYLHRESKAALSDPKYIPLPNHYFDEYLIPFIPEICKDHLDSDVLYKKFMRLLCGCFNGEFSHKVWDETWKHLDAYEQIFYSTASSYNEHTGAIEIAVRAGSVESLKRLDQIYQDSLEKELHRRVMLHLNFEGAMVNACLYQCKSRHPEKVQKCFLLLLEMCGRYAALIDSKADSSDFANKKFTFSYGARARDDKPLLEFFLETCGWLCREKLFVAREKIIAWTIYQIYKCVSENTSHEACLDFQEKFSECLKENEKVKIRFESLARQGIFSEYNGSVTTCGLYKNTGDKRLYDVREKDPVRAITNVGGAYGHSNQNTRRNL